MRKEGNYLKVSDVKDYLASNHILLNNKRKVTTPKIAKYFNVVVKVKDIKGKSARCIFDLDFRY